MRLRWPFPSQPTTTACALFLLAVLAPLSDATAQQAFTYTSAKQKQAHNLYLLAEGGDQQSIDALRQAANAGDAWSALQYGYLLDIGAGGMKVDKPAALSAYLRAAPGGGASATDGLPIAAYNAGLIYLWGDGATLRTDITEAIKWLRVAALSDSGTGGVLPAAMQLAVIYENGFGRQPRNLPESARWYFVAARFGDPVAMYKKGRILVEGDYVARSPAEGLLMLERAAERGSQDAKYYLASIYARGTEYAQQSHYLACYWLMVAGMHLNGKVRAEYNDSITDAMSRLSPGEIKQAQSQATKFIHRYIVRIPNIRYNAPINAPITFY